MNRAFVNKNDFVIRIYLGSSTLDLSPRSSRPTGWRLFSKTAVAPNAGHGLAYVSRELDVSLFRDGGWGNEHMNDAVVLRLVQKDLTLPADVRDNGWTPIVFNYFRSACFGWMHPQCLELLHTARTEVVTVGHTGKRGCHWPTHDIGPTGLYPTTSRIYRGVHVLDARGGDGSPWNSTEVYSGCGGFCQAVAHDTATHILRMADILEFAMHQRGGVVASRRATHSSVSAARILEFCFHRNVDYRHALTPAPCTVCRCRTHAQPEHVFAALRTLPKPDDRLLLRRRVDGSFTTSSAVLI